MRKFWDAGENPPDGVLIHYYLKEAAAEITLSILDEDGRIIQSFSSNLPGADENTPEPGRQPNRE